MSLKIKIKSINLKEEEYLLIDLYSLSKEDISLKGIIEVGHRDFSCRVFVANINGKSVKILNIREKAQKLILEYINDRHLSDSDKIFSINAISISIDYILNSKKILFDLLDNILYDSRISESGKLEEYINCNSPEDEHLRIIREMTNSVFFIGSSILTFSTHKMSTLEEEYNIKVEERFINCQTSHFFKVYDVVLNLNGLKTEFKIFSCTDSKLYLKAFHALNAIQGSESVDYDESLYILDYIINLSANTYQFDILFEDIKKIRIATKKARTTTSDFYMELFNLDISESMKKIYEVEYGKVIYELGFKKYTHNKFDSNIINEISKYLDSSLGVPKTDIKLKLIEVENGILKYGNEFLCSESHIGYRDEIGELHELRLGYKGELSMFLYKYGNHKFSIYSTYSIETKDEKIFFIFSDEAFEVIKDNKNLSKETLKEVEEKQKEYFIRKYKISKDNVNILYNNMMNS